MDIVKWSKCIHRWCDPSIWGLPTRTTICSQRWSLLISRPTIVDLWRTSVYQWLPDSIDWCSCSTKWMTISWDWMSNLNSSWSLRTELKVKVRCRTLVSTNQFSMIEVFESRKKEVKLNNLLCYSIGVPSHPGHYIPISCYATYQPTKW